jgi:gluconate 5-dehydrogenase
MSIKELFDLSGRTAIVTGGASGIGWQIAAAYAEAGANIVLCSRKANRCEAAAEKINELYKVEALGLGCDVTNKSSIESLINVTVDRFKRIDILVNNSGATWGANVSDMTLEQWEKVIRVNLTGTFLFCQAVGNIMKQQKQGKIINISSICGIVGLESTVAESIGYTASKAGVIGFTKDLAVKWAPYNINVNAIYTYLYF